MISVHAALYFVVMLASSIAWTHYGHQLPRRPTTICRSSQFSLEQGVDSVKQLDKPQTIAVVGSGAVGCYYGARLFEIGHSVKFFMRGEHLKQSSRRGLNLTSIDGDVCIPPEDLEAYGSTEAIGDVDWILVALKSSSLEAIPDLIHPLLSKETRVLVIMNGLIEEDLIRLIKAREGESTDERTPLKCCKALYGGMAFLCSNRVAPGRVDHSYAGLLSAGVASTILDDPLGDQQSLEELWRHAKVPVTYEPSLLRGRWRKMIWNLPFNGISVAMGGITVDKIVEDPGLRRLSYRIMDETIAIANADMERMYGKDGFQPLSEADKQPMMTLSDLMGPYKTSTMLDLTNRRSMEVKYLFQEPVERARRLRVPCPHLETIVAQIEAFQRMYNLY